MTDTLDEKKIDWTQNKDEEGAVLSATKPTEEQGAAEPDPTIRDEEDAEQAHGGGVQTQGLTDKT